LPRLLISFLDIDKSPARAGLFYFLLYPGGWRHLTSNNDDGASSGGASDDGGDASPNTCGDGASPSAGAPQPR
jgi:hypothetical protein